MIAVLARPVLALTSLVSMAQRLRVVASLSAKFNAWRASRSPEPRILFVTASEQRFSNMTVNQRLRTLKSVGRVDVLSCYPDAFPPDIGVGSVRIIRAPISTRMPPGPMRLSAFTIDAALYAIAAWIMGRRYQVTYTLQDTSAVAGWLLHGRRGCWVIDAVDDPALELRNAQIQGSQVKVLVLRARDVAFRFLARRADLVFTIGSSAGDLLPSLLSERYGIAPSRLVPLPQAVDVAAIQSAVARLRDDDDPGVVGHSAALFYVGRISRLRGVDILIEAGRILSAAGYSIEIRLGGWLREDGQSLIEPSDRGAPRVTYLGVLPTEETLGEIARAAVCVCPFPDTEELAPVQPVKVLEFLAAGRPVVTTRLPGTEALIRDGVNGLLVPPSDASAMANAIARIIGDPEFSAALQDGAIASAEQFDSARVGALLVTALSTWLRTDVAGGKAA